MKLRGKAMKAAVIHNYGSADVLQIEEIEKPRIKPDQLLVKVYASSVNPIDWKMRKGMLRFITGNRFPLVLGFDVVGEVVEVGDRVTRFKTGDIVYAGLTLSGGGYATFVAVPEKVAALKPNNMTYEEAAATPGSALTALQSLCDLGKIRSGQSVLVNGASGGVGSFAVQIAKSFNARVTAVCSTKNLEWVKALGADLAIDYTQQDFTRDAARYDIVFDAVGKRSFSQCKTVLKPNGVYITTLPNAEVIFWGIVTALLPWKKAKLVLQSQSGAALEYLKDAIDAGKIRAAIDRVYPLSEIAKAHRYSESERAAGKIVIAIEHS
jgi:NADPH:quinone reductase-like Zn-dependent oxidoreductase